MESALEEGREALQGDDVAAMEKARDRITEHSHKLAEAMYKQAAQNPDGDGQPSGSARARKDDGGGCRRGVRGRELVGRTPPCPLIRGGDPENASRSPPDKGGWGVLGGPDGTDYRAA